MKQIFTASLLGMALLWLPQCVNVKGGLFGAGPGPIYTCTNGIATEGMPDGSGNVESCTSCNPGFVLESNACRASVYTCANGIASMGNPAGTDDVELCTECNTGFTLHSPLCRPNFFLDTNDVTILCPDAAVGDRGMVNGVEYTKRIDKNDIDTDNAATTCTSDITDMSTLFRMGHHASFNEDISSWDTSSVTDMSSMFWVPGGYAFNQDISYWDVSNVTNMNFMFAEAAAFNQPIGDWDVSKVTQMGNMFNSASVFDQDLSGWWTDP